MFIAKYTKNYLRMYFLLKSIEAIIMINANTKKFSISKLSLMITKRMQVKTIARNGVIFFIKYYYYIPYISRHSSNVIHKTETIIRFFPFSYPYL